MSEREIPETLFEEVTYDHDEEVYRASNGETVKFTKMLHVKLCDELHDVKLSYTRQVYGRPTSKPVPCIRIGSDKYLMNGHVDSDSDDTSTDLEIASDCIQPLG